MLAKPIRALELHYPMIQFLIITLIQKEYIIISKKRGKSELGAARKVSLDWSQKTTPMCLLLHMISQHTHDPKLNEFRNSLSAYIKGIKLLHQRKAFFVGAKYMS